MPYIILSLYSLPDLIGRSNAEFQTQSTLFSVVHGIPLMGCFYQLDISNNDGNNCKIKKPGYVEASIDIGIVHQSEVSFKEVFIYSLSMKT